MAAARGRRASPALLLAILECLRTSLAFAFTLSPSSGLLAPAFSLLRPISPPHSSTGQTARVCCTPRPSDVLPISLRPEQLELLTVRGRDVIVCDSGTISFMRAAFGTNEDVEAELVRAQPYQADSPLRNQDMIEGKIAMVLRGSQEGVKCSFVDKARRVAAAGAVGLIVVNNEDTLVSPGDSAREGTDIDFPVVGVKLSDAERLHEGGRAKLVYQPATLLSSEQKKYLRALAFSKIKQGTLPKFSLDKDSPSEKILEGLDVLLSQHELLMATLADESGAAPLSILDIEDVVDVATVLADNLGGAVVLISQQWFIMYRASPFGNGITLPKEGEASPLQIDLADGLMGLVNLATSSDSEDLTADEDTFLA